MKRNDLKRVAAALFGSLAMLGQAAFAQEAKVDSIEFYKQAISSTRDVEFLNNLMVKLEPPVLEKETSDKVPDALSAAPKERPKVEFKPLTNILLGLSALIGPTLIFLLFRNGQSKRRK